MKPIHVRVSFSDPLGSLEGVDDVGQVHVGVRLVQERRQALESFHYAGFELVELGPMGDLKNKWMYGMVTFDSYSIMGKWRGSEFQTLRKKNENQAQDQQVSIMHWSTVLNF